MTSPMVSLTPAAAARIREVVAEGRGAGLRFGLTDGGCSGYTYLLDFEQAPDDDDVVFDDDGARVFVHPMHLPLVRGSVIEFLDEDFQTGFRIQNPNAKRICGCGESFDVG